jgi:thiol-disulfide isomerase/thioredoxin
VEAAIWGKENAGSRDSTAEAIIEARIACDPSAYYLKSEYYIGIGDTAGAIDAASAYVKAIESGEIPWCNWYVPDEAPPIFMRLAEHDFETGDFKMSLRRAKSAIEYSQDENMIGEFYAFCAECDIALKQPEKAKSDVIEAVVRGAVADAKELLPDIYPDVEPDEALKLVFEEASALAPESPKFAIVTIDDDTVAPGDAILCLDFWNPGCGPCIGEMPLLSEFAKNHAEESVRFLSVSAAPKAHFEATEYPIENWALCPSSRQAFMDMGVAAIPHFFLIDSRGHIRYNQIGAPVDTASVAALLDLLATELEVVAE